MNGELIAPGEWMRALRTMRFGTIRGVRGATFRGVAFTLASYAEYTDGTRVHPGIALLAIHSEVDYRTARTVVTILRDLGLIEMVRGGRRKGYADEYRLAMPDDITDRVKVLNPADVDLEVERIREANRSRPTKPVRDPQPPVPDSRPLSDVRVPEPPVLPGTEHVVRVPAVPVPAVPARNRTGTAGTANLGRTGASDPSYGVRYAPPPSHPHRDTRTTETKPITVRTEGDGPRARGPDQGQILSSCGKCVHGFLLEGDAIIRCPDPTHTLAA